MDKNGHLSTIDRCRHHHQDGILSRDKCPHSDCCGSNVRVREMLLASCLAAAIALPAAAGEYWLATQASIANTNPFTPSFWTDAGGVPASDAFTASDTLHVEGKSLSMFSSRTFNGALHIGAEDGTSGATINVRQNTLTAGDLRWHRGEVTHNYGGRHGTIAGTMLLDNSSSDHNIGTFSNSAKSGIRITAAMSCEDSGVVLTVASRALAGGMLALAGNNAGYIGKISQKTATTPFILASANALGNPEVPRADALSIDVANAVLSIYDNIRLNDARGIMVNYSGLRVRATTYDNYLGTYNNCTAFELPMPISGSYGFTKDGTGTVTLSGAYTAGAITVADGTLEIAATASFPAGQSITVNAGASLFVHQSLSAFSITAEDGATVERVIDPIIADYDPVTTNAAAVVRPSSFDVPAGYVQPLALSSAITLPFHETLRLEVLTVAAGAADLSAEDFEDSTPKTYGLPNTSIEVVKDGDGIQHVFIVAKPVVKSVAAFPTESNSMTLNGKASLWSDGNAVHTGADYLIVHSVACMGDAEFRGDSLTVANDHVYVRRDARTTKTTFYPGIEIRQNDSTGGGNWTVRGSFAIAGEFDSTSYLTFKNYFKGGSYHGLSAALSGEGPLRITASNIGNYLSGDGTFVRLYGDNSAYRGRFIVSNDSSPDEYSGTQLWINSTNALGGALDEFKYDAITLAKYSQIHPTTSMTLKTANRGFYGSGPFGFDVPDGVTLTVKEPIRAAGAMYKHGAGNLLLGGEISYGADGTGSSGTLYVREGGIGALNDAAVAGLDVVFSNGTQIVVSPDAALVNGFTGTLSVLPNLATGGDGKVVVSPADGFVMPESEVFDCAICTAPSASGDLSPLFTPVGPKGFGATLEKQNVELDGVPCVRYSVTYQRVATFIYIR